MIHSNKYKQTSIQTASPAQLLIMLYDGAIRFCRQAIHAIEQNQIEEANMNIQKVQNIIHEFSSTLDKNAPIAEQLLPLYEYFQSKLVEANMHKKTEPLEEILEYLKQLKETWMQAAIEAKKQPQTAGTGS
ncbi:flagellar export chaperone FliS [Longirhabdus pacifica]|uniref:flagellar export chaperone FliS n=1 Tax=Longirhabdus pacifica TaxID=2305227 RepID=UPI0010087B43|nr:flagellar export chaperone FliS [Longirhabdus pacifica]